MDRETVMAALERFDFIYNVNGQKVCRDDVVAFLNQQANQIENLEAKAKRVIAEFDQFGNRYNGDRAYYALRELSNLVTDKS